MRNRFAILALLSAVLAMPACTVWREHPGSSKWTDATGGEGLERSFWKEVKDKKWNELEHHLASNYVAVSAQGGRLDKAAALAQIQKLRLDDFTLGDVQTELNSDTFVVTLPLVPCAAPLTASLADRTAADDDSLAEAKCRMDGDCPFRSGTLEIVGELPRDGSSRNEFKPQPEIRWLRNPSLATVLAVVV
jgi:hypothetical protein